MSEGPPGILRNREEKDVPKSEHTAPRRLNTDIPHILPHERVFPIQIGSELFRLSGASISSDAPSYFSQFFQCQLKQAEDEGTDSNSIRTLYIDRDPVTFGDISLHLQGYHVSPRDSSHFVKLFADAQFYSLPRLISQLYEESIFISIGYRDFQIPRELFSDPGNSPNYFSLGFAVFFSSPTEVFPGLDREGLLRPPSIMPPAVPNRSADIFADILHCLQGYPLHIRNEEHRAELLRDCRYFHLKGLEQKLIRHSISFNLSRRRHEITLRLEDVRQSGISVLPEPSNSQQQQQPPPEPASRVMPQPQPLLAWVNYARPFVDEKSYELVLEIGDECTRLHSPSNPTGIRAEFFGDGKARVARLFEVIATKLNLPTSQPLGLLMKRGGASGQPASPGNTPISEDWVRCVIDENTTYVRLDGRDWVPTATGDSRGGDGINTTSSKEWLDEPGYRKRRRVDSDIGGGEGGEGKEKGESWIVKTGQWRLRVQSVKNGSRSGNGNGNGDAKAAIECVLVGVRIEATREEYGRNMSRGFLGS